MEEWGQCAIPSGAASRIAYGSRSARGDGALKTFHWNVFLTLPLMVHQKQPYTVCRAVFLLQHPGTLRLSRCRRGREQLVPAACSGGHKIERGSLWCLISRKEGLHHPPSGKPHALRKRLRSPRIVFAYLFQNVGGWRRKREAPLSQCRNFAWSLHRFDDAMVDRPAAALIK